MSVFVMSNRNIIIPSPDGKESVRLKRGDICQGPDWAAQTAYFKALAADGKLVVSEKSEGTEKSKSRSRRGREAEQRAENQERSETGPEEGHQEHAGGEEE